MRNPELGDLSDEFDGIRHDLFIEYLSGFITDESDIPLYSFGGLTADERKRRDNQNRQ